jgi:hypothetical protein
MTRYLEQRAQVKVTLRLTVSQSVSLGIEPHLGPWPDIYFCLTVTFLFPWGALSDERTGLSFVCAADPCQLSLSRVLVPWDLRPYFTVSDLRLPFSSPPTTRRVTVEVFDPSSTRVWTVPPVLFQDNSSARTMQKIQPHYCCRGVFTVPLHSNGNSM